MFKSKKHTLEVEIARTEAGIRKSEREREVLKTKLEKLRGKRRAQMLPQRLEGKWLRYKPTGSSGLQYVYVLRKCDKGTYEVVQIDGRQLPANDAYMCIVAGAVKVVRSAKFYFIE